MKKYSLILLLLFVPQSGLCKEILNERKGPASAVVLDIEMLGDTSVKSLQENDALLLKKYSKVLREQLKKEGVFNVMDDTKSLDLINQESENQYLHRCNGCEFELGKKLGAQVIIAPWVFRMSILIQTLVIEVRDVETGRLILKSPYNFRGNIDRAWQKTILYAVKDLKKILQQGVKVGRE